MRQLEGDLFLEIMHSVFWAILGQSARSLLITGVTFYMRAVLYHSCAVSLQIERISHLEAERDRLLAQLPADVQEKVITRQKEAATEEGRIHLKAQDECSSTACLLKPIASGLCCYSSALDEYVHAAA